MFFEPRIQKKYLTHRVILFIFFIFSSPFSRADCSTLISNLLKTLHPGASLGRVEQNVCKVWPYSPDKTLVVITMLSDIPEQDTKNPTYDMEVVVVDTKSGNMLYNYFEKNAFSDDAIFTDSINIDTGRYQLSSAVRAFGIRIVQRNRAAYNKFISESLSLYYINNKAIQPVMRRLTMLESTGEWQEYSVVGKCIGNFKDINRTLLVSNEKHNNFNDLKVNQLLVTSEFKRRDHDDCYQVANYIKKSSLMLKYDGREYLIPKEYRDDL